MFNNSLSQIKIFYSLLLLPKEKKEYLFMKPKSSFILMKTKRIKQLIVTRILIFCLCHQLKYTFDGGVNFLPYYKSYFNF